MLRKTFFTPLFAASALALVATPAYAGKEDRARAAIAAAEAKLHTAETMGASVEMPREAAQARAVLATAREYFAADRNRESIAEAIRASELADAAIGELQRGNQQALAERNNEVAAANQEATVAQQNAADANARAAAAERSAAALAAEAQAARNAALAAQQPQVETTVTTQQPARATARRSTKTTVTRRTRRPATASSGQVTTTTTVTQPRY